jgi:type II secretory ATPase GspE/PulE/Tfp pilus assembly ATPase PilB-like protein
MQGLELLGQVEVGGYINAWKVVPALIILLIWTKLLSWVDKDAEAAMLPRMPLNAGLLTALIVGFAAFLYMPTFITGLAALLAVMVLSLGLYFMLRQQKVGLGDLNKQFSDWTKSLTTRKKKDAKLRVGLVSLLNKGGVPLDIPPADSPDRAAYETSQEIFADALKKGADRIEVVPGEGGSRLRYYVDGVAYTGVTIPREASAAAIGYLKAAMGMDTSDRRKPQSGVLKSQLDGRKIEMRVTTAGSTAGEQMVVEVDPKKRYDRSLDQLGFLPDQLATLTDLVQDNTGLVLLAAPKGHGLSSLCYAMARKHDAFLTHIHTIERAPEIDLEGITQNKLPAGASPAEEAKMVAWVVSQEPETLLVPQVEDPTSAQELSKFAADGKRVYVGLRAGTTFDALTAWRKLVGDDKLALKGLRMIVAGRLARTLCMACKVGYTPDPETMRKLNMSPDTAGTLYQARTTPMLDQRGREVPCQFCNDLRYKGRTGIYELFAVDDEVRQTILAGGSVDRLKSLFRKQKRRYLQEVALLKVQEGDTSVQEVLRALKADDGGSSRSASQPASKPPSSSSSRRT